MSCRSDNLGETKESEAKEPEAHGPPEDLAKDEGLDEVERSKKNSELRQVEKTMGSSGVHRFGNPPVCCGESVVGDHPCASWVQDQVDGHSGKNEPKNGPGESVPPIAHM